MGRAGQALSCAGEKVMMPAGREPTADESSLESLGLLYAAGPDGGKRAASRLTVRATHPALSESRSQALTSQLSQAEVGLTTNRI